MSAAPSATGRCHSKFGGTWIDRFDFLDQLNERIRIGKIPSRLDSDIRTLERDGVVVLERAASEAELVRYTTAISAAFRDGHSRLLSQEPGQIELKRVTAGMNRKG